MLKPQAPGLDEKKLSTGELLADSSLVFFFFILGAMVQLHGQTHFCSHTGSFLPL
jgi:hypothetical protein